MAPNDTRRSGEHRAMDNEQFVTQTQFGSFVQRFDQFAKDSLASLASVNAQLADGRTQFAVIQRDIREANSQLTKLESRSDDHSGRVMRLEDAQRVSAALKAERAKAAQPSRHLATKVFETVITAAVLGFLAMCYNAWRDAALEDRARERDKHSAVEHETPKPPSMKPTQAAPAN